MKNEERLDKLKTAIAEWQKKYRVQDGDPLLAALELFHLYIADISLVGPSGASIPSFIEFRNSVESLDQQSRTISKSVAELTETLRSMPSVKRQFRFYFTTALVLTAFLALVAGILIGKFIWVS